MNLFVFDIETIPDTEGLRKLYALDEEIAPAQIAEMAFQKRRQATGGDFLQHHLHKVVAISCSMNSGCPSSTISTAVLPEQNAVISSGTSG